MGIHLNGRKCSRISISLKSFSAYDKMVMPPPKTPSNSSVIDSDQQKYFQSVEGPLEDDFKVDAECSGFTTGSNHNLSDPSLTIQFFPSNFDPNCNYGEIPVFGKVSPFHPICCKIHRLIDFGAERKQIEQYVSGRAQRFLALA